MAFKDVDSRSSAEPSQQPELDDVTNLDNAAFIQDLLELVPYLANLDEFIGQFVGSGGIQDAAEILGLFDQETMDSFLGTLRVKVAQLDGIRLHLRKNRSFPNRDLLEELLEDAQPKCRQTAESVARLKCSLAAASADSDGNYNRSDDDDDKDDDFGDSNDDPGAKQQIYVSDLLQQQQSPSSLVAYNAVFSEADREEEQTVLHGYGMEASALLPDLADLCFEEPQEHSKEQRNENGGSLPPPVIRQNHTTEEQLLELDNQEEDENEEEESDSDNDDDGPNCVSKPTTGALSVTDDWRQSTVQQNPKHIKIRRKELLEDCIPFYETASRSTMRRILSVKFVGEPGIDMGALTREFFSLGFEAFIGGTFKNQSLFQGQRGHLLPDPGSDCRVFNYLGKMIVHAVVNECRGFPGLSPAIVHYMTNPVRVTAIEDSHPPLSISDVADPELNPILQKLDSAEELTPEEQSSLENWMTESNCRIFLSTAASSRMNVIQHLLIYYVFTKRLRQIDALAAGLSYLDLREFLMKNRTEKNVAFVLPSPDDVSITEGALLAAIVTRGDPPGSGGGDVSALDLFVQFVKELHNNVIAEYGLVDLVRFMTSSPYLPHRIVVSFRSDGWHLPMAHVCYNEIQLPTVHRTYDEFKRAMMTALRHGTSGFDMD